MVLKNTKNRIHSPADVAFGDLLYNSCVSGVNPPPPPFLIVQARDGARRRLEEAIVPCGSMLAPVVR